MDTVGSSSESVERIRVFPTRRTSRQLFLSSVYEIMVFLVNFFVNGVVFVHADIAVHLDHVEYAFETLHQRRQLRKFPATFPQFWAYIGLPQQIVSNDLGVSLHLLERRTIEFLGGIWPLSSDPHFVLVAVQYARATDILNDQFEHRDQRHVRVPREMPLLQVHQQLILQFDIEQPALAVTELHVEINGERFGPLVYPWQWDEVLSLQENVHKVDLLLVHMN